MPENYKELAEIKILSNQESEAGKVKYNDKILQPIKDNEILS